MVMSRNDLIGPIFDPIPSPVRIVYLEDNFETSENNIEFESFYSSEFALNSLAVLDCNELEVYFDTIQYEGDFNWGGRPGQFGKKLFK